MFSGFRSLNSDVRGYSTFKSGCVPVNYIKLMKMFKGEQQLGTVESNIQSTPGQVDTKYMRTEHALHQNGVPVADDGTIHHH